MPLLSRNEGGADRFIRNSYPPWAPVYPQVGTGISCVPIDLSCVPTGWYHWKCMVYELRLVLVDLEYLQVGTGESCIQRKHGTGWSRVPMLCTGVSSVPIGWFWSVLYTVKGVISSTFQFFLNNIFRCSLNFFPIEN